MSESAHKELVEALKSAIEDMGIGDVEEIDCEVLANVAIEYVRDMDLSGYE